MKHLKRKLTAAILSVLLATSSFTAAPLSVTAATTEAAEAGENIAGNESTGIDDGVGAAEETDIGDSVGEVHKSGVIGDCTWELDEEGTLTISGNGEIVDDHYSHFGITEWGKKIKCVIILDGVTYIGYNAFRDCTGLTSVTIPDSVTYIGSYAFENCTNLTSVTIPDSVTYIGSYAFDNTAWYNAQSDGVVYAGKVAYKYKGEMPYNTSVVIKDGTKCITGEAFCDCYNLTSINIPDSVTTIGHEAFRDCTGLTSIDIPDSVTTIEFWTFYGCTGLTSINIPDSVTTIGHGAFRDCTGLTSITIPDSVTTISDYTFSGCTGLTNINIPDRVTTIGIYAFKSCINLTSITIPGSVTTIGTGAFSGCIGLTSIIIPDSVTTIDYYTFDGCTGLTNITIPDSVTTIESRSFRDCTSLTNIYIPDSVTTLSGFDGCTGLTNITIPDSVTTIGDDAFRGCVDLTDITIPESVTAIGRNPFYGTEWYNNQPNGLIYVGKIVCTYKGEMPYDTSIVIKDGTKGIAGYAFGDCYNLTSVTIPDSVTSIGSDAFECCTGLTSVTIPDSVTDIGSKAFKDCTGLTSVTIPDNVTYISYEVFKGCTGLTSITIPDSVTSIGWHAFYECTGLNDVYINDIKAWCEISFNFSYGDFTENPLIYAKNLYVNNELITDLTIPNSVTDIGDSAFVGYTGLKSVTIPDTVSTIGSYAFSNCKNLETVSIGENVREINCGVFQGCTNLASVSIGKNVRGIGNYAFGRCENLETVVIPDNVRYIDGYAFCDCYNLSSLSIGLYLNDVGDRVFSGCRNINSITIHEKNPYFLYKDGILYNKQREELVWCNCNEVNDASITIPEIIPGTEGPMVKRVKKIKDFAFSDVYLEKLYIDKSIESINDYAFGWNHNRIDIYYNGTESQWKQIDGYDDLYNVVMHFLDSEPVYGHLYESGNVIDGIKTELNESWFEDNSYYNHDLSKLCSEMVVMGYHAEDEVIDLEKSLSDLGFSNIEHCNDTGRDEENYFFASRSIEKNRQTYNLVFCGCIGSNGLQWNSDFDPQGFQSEVVYSDGKSNNHKGFNDAKNYIKRYLFTYLISNGFDRDNTILLLTGHSRGAAAANLIAAEIMEDIWLIKPENLFTYTFATPNTTCDDNRNDPKYNSIYNIVFPTDFVTKVMPTKWGYGRYGTTYALPTQSNDKNYTYETDEENAITYIEYIPLDGSLNPDYTQNTRIYLAGYKYEMLKYRKLLNNGDGSFEDYDGEKDVRGIIDSLSWYIENENAYYNKPLLWFKKQVALIPVYSYKIPFYFFKEAFCPFVNGTKDLTEATIKMVISETIPWNIYAQLADFFIINQKLSPRFEDAHKSETYCAFMLALDSDEVTTYRKGYNGSVNCPVDIEITEKESGEVVGRIVNNTVDEEIAAKPNSVVMTVDGDEKEFWLPGNGEYDVRLIGNDNGVMDYTVREIDPDTGETYRVNYYDVPVEKDKAYTDFFTSEKAFVITAESGSELTPDEAFNSENEVTYSVTVTAEGSGTASDSLTVPSGDYVTLTANPVKSEFLGWYQNDTLVSTDLEYRFRPTEDISLTAKFTGEDLEPVEFGDVDVDGEVTISDATQIQMYLAELVELEDVQVLLSDYNLDGSVDISDATQIQLKLAELI